MVRLLVVWMALYGAVLAQPLKLVATVSDSQRQYLEYMRVDDVLSDTFFLDSTSIYIPNMKFESKWPNSMYVWNYHSPFSRSNPRVIEGFEATHIKKAGDLIIDARLEFCNVRTGNVSRVLEERETWDRRSHRLQVSFCIYDSVIYFFSTVGVNDGRLQFFKYDLRANKKSPVGLDMLVNRLNAQYSHARDILVTGNHLYILYAEYGGTDREKEFVACWDMRQKKELWIRSLPTLFYEQILGVDKWGDLYIYGGSVEKEYPLLIFSPGLDSIADRDVYPQVMTMEFMKGNRLISSPAMAEDMVIGSMDDDARLYFMAKTEKGLFFMEYEYLPLLKNHFLSKPKAELRRMLNTIYARRGKVFSDKSLREYFSQQAWYKPNPQFSAPFLTRFDRRCIDVLREIAQK